MAKVKEYLMSLMEHENVVPINKLVTMKSKVFQCIDKDLVLCIIGEADFVITQEGYEALKMQMSNGQLKTHRSVRIDPALASMQYENMYTTEDVINNRIKLNSRIYNS